MKEGIVLSRPYKCPVCEGTGQLIVTEYNIESTGGCYIESESCHACRGTGVVWSLEVYPHYEECPNCKQKIWIYCAATTETKDVK